MVYGAGHAPAANGRLMDGTDGKNTGMENAMTTLPLVAPEMPWFRTAPLTVAAFCTVLAVSSPVLSQSFENQDASENIADSEITVEATKAAERADVLLETIAGLRESIDRVKIITNMEKIDVAYLSDLIGADAPAQVEEAIEANSERISELQKALEASAIFYNALTSRDVNIPDVLSIKLDEPNATIFVRGVAPDEGISLDEAADQ